MQPEASRGLADHQQFAPSQEHLLLHRLHLLRLSKSLVVVRRRRLLLLYWPLHLLRCS